MTGVHELPEIPGVITRSQIAETIDAITSVQLPNGNVPWTPGQHTDPWNMVEALMAMTLGGRIEEARAGFEWPRASAQGRRVARGPPRRGDRGPDPRHQRHLLRRHRRVAPPPRHR